MAELRLSNRDVARAVDVSEATVSRWRNDKDSPALKHRAPLEALLGLVPGALGSEPGARSVVHPHVDPVVRRLDEIVERLERIEALLTLGEPESAAPLNRHHPP